MPVKHLVRQIRYSDSPHWRRMREAAKAVRRASLPRFALLGGVLAGERAVRGALWGWLMHQYVNQIMGRRCTSLGRGIHWGAEVPLVYGDGSIHIGDYVSVGRSQTWVVGLGVCDDPVLTIGAHTSVNYRTTISVAKSVTIGNHCSLAGELLIFDNSSHPMEWSARRRRERITSADVAPVVIEDDVWLASRVTVLKGVTIGRGAVVAANSVVVRDIPPFTLAAGVPARPIRDLPVAVPHG